jgi:mono/diheme cytochrome c family protein
MPTLEKLGYSDLQSLLNRGKERYEIYCTPCHGTLGNGQGPVAERGFAGVLDIASETYQGTIGRIYNAINKGGPLMPSYAYQIKVNDRWAIVAYVKVLQQAAKDPSYTKTAPAPTQNN